MGWEDEILAEYGAATAPSLSISSWEDEILAEYSARDSVAPTLNFTATPSAPETPETSLAADPQTAMAQLHDQYPDASAAELIQMYNSRTGYTPESDPLALTGREIQVPVKERGGMPGNDQFAKDVKEQLLIDRIGKKAEELDRIEKSKSGFGKSYDLGKIGVAASQLAFDAVQGGHHKAYAQALELQKRAGQVTGADAETHKGFISSTAHDVARMGGPLAESLAWGASGPVAGAAGGAAAGPAGAAVGGLVGTAVGAYKNLDFWAREGGGSLAEKIAEEGGDPMMAKEAAAIGGAIYAATELLQIGRLKKLGVTKKAADSLQKKIAHVIMAKAKDWAVETAQEGVQEGTLVAVSLHELKKQGLLEDQDLWSMIKHVGSAAWKAAKGAAAAMGALSVGGATLGTGKVGHQHLKAASQQKQQDAPFISAAIDGKEIRDTETGEVFTPKPGAGRSKIRDGIRGWLRKHNNVEVVVDRPVTEFGVKDENGNARDWSEFEGEPSPLDDDFSFEWLDDDVDTPWGEEEETPPETQENTPPSASNVEVEEVSTQPEESAPQAKEQAENKAEGVETEPNNIRTRFDALQTLEVNSTEVKSLGRGEGFKQRAIGWLTEKDVFGEYTNGDKGWDIIFNKKGARSVLGHNAGDGKVALLEHVPDIIENGVFLETISKKDGLDSHIFAAKATIDGVPSTVGFVVRDDVNGKRYYDHAIRVEDGHQAESRISAQESTSKNLPEDPNTISNIVQRHLNRKKIAEKSGGQVSDGKQNPRQNVRNELADPALTDKIPNPAPKVNKKIEKVSEPPKEDDLLDVLNGVPGDLIYGDATVKELTNEVYRMRKEMGAKYLEQEKPVPKRVKDKYFQLEERLEQRKREIAADYHSSAKPVADSDAIPEDQEALRAAERDAGAVAEEADADDADADEEEGAPTKRTKKVKTVEADDIDILSGYEDKRTKKYITPHSYKARKFELRHETRRAIGGSVYETTGGKDVHIGEAQDLDEASELMAAHINKTPEQTKNRTKMKSWTKGERGYYDSELHVGRGDGGAEYSKDRFAEGGGEDYIREVGEGSQTTESKGRDRVKADDFQKNAEWVFGAAPVRRLDGSEFSKSDVDLVTQVAQYFESIGGEVERDDLGEVELTRRGVKDSMSHGIGRAKAAAFMAVPDVIRHGKIIDRQTNWKGRGYDTYVIDAPISIGKTEYIMEVIVEQSLHGKNRYYLHEVEIKEKAQGVFKTATERSTPQAPKLIITKKIGDRAETGTRAHDTAAENLPQSPNTNKILHADEKVNSQTKKYSSRSGEANTDPFADTPKAAPEASDLRPVEMPELVQMVKELLGKVPQVRKTLRGGAYGLAVHDKDGKWINIQVAADLPKNAGQTLKTLAHEIGHVMTKYGGDGKYKAVATKIKNAADALAQLMEDDSGAEIKTIYDELYALSKKWRPFEEGKDPKHDKYRKKGEEVFADAISVYLNDPAMLEAEAPNFWRVFHGWEGERNPFTGVYKAIQELYGKGRDAVVDSRSDRRRAGYAKGREQDREAAKRRREEEKAETSLGRVLAAIRIALWDRNGALYQLVENVKKNGAKIADKVNPYLNKRAMPFVKSQQEAYRLEVRNAVSEIVGELDVKTMDDIGEYLENARIAVGDRGDIWNPGGETSETSKEALDGLKRRLGAKRFALVKAAAEKFVEIRFDHIIPEIVNSGTFSKEYVEKVLNNKNYATFEVLEELEKEYGGNTVSGITGLPVGAHKQMGTTRDIHNPFVSTIRNDMQMLAFIDRANFARNAVDLLLNHKNTIGFEAKEQEQRRGGGYEKYHNTVFVIREGKTVAYQVSDELVPMFTIAGKPNILLKIWDKLAGNPMREILTQKNPAFWVWNIQRDFRSFHRNVRGSVVIKAMYWWKAFWKIKGYTWDGKMDAVVRAALRERAMLPSSAYAKDNYFDDLSNSFDTRLKGFETEEGQAGFCLRRLKEIGRLLDTINDTLELTTKLAGYELLRDQGGMSAEQRAHTVRTRIGTPDFLSGGTATPILNRILMFSNVNIQGLRESLNAAREDPKRAMFMMGLYSMVPALINVLAERGLLSEALARLFGGDDDKENKRWWIRAGEFFEESYARIPKFERVYRWAIPLFTVKGETSADDKTLYLPLPTSEVGSVQQGMWYHLFNMMFEKRGEAVVDDLMDVFSDIYSAAPGNAHPLLKVGAALGQYAGHQNPVDPHYKTPIIPQKEYRVSTANDLKHLGRYAWNNLGGATLWRLDRKPLDFKDKWWLEKALGLPLVGAPLGRVVRVSNRGLEEEKAAKREAARLERRRLAAEAKSQK